MPMINIEDVYILDETGAEVDKVTGLYFKNENASDTEKAKARANIGAGGSNRNLLNNWYFVGGGSQLRDGVFPINQRGQTQYTATSQAFDRWLVWVGCTATLTQSGLNIQANTDGACFSQSFLYDPSLSESPHTVTFLSTNGEEIVYQFKIDTSIGWQGGTLIKTDNPNFYIDVNYSAPYVQVVLCKRFDGTPHTITLKAVKYEKGIYSTLANDVPPDFGAELAKCQRRLFRVSPMGTSSRGYAGFGSANSGKNILVFVPTPVTLAAQPTVSFSNCNAYNYVAGGSIAISSISIDSWTQNGVFLSCAPSDTSQVVQYQPYVLRVASGGFLDLSCEP